MSTVFARAAIARQRGFSLVELIAFIVIMGIAAVALLSMYRAVLPHGTTPAEITLATELAQERMELILGQRVAGGYSPLADPCVLSLAAVCTPTSGYTVSSVIVGGWSGIPATSYKEIGVTVLGPDGTQHAKLSAVVADY
jgi:prepilin-type N-terminal cleavage/methylation domain-containing protein